MKIAVALLAIPAFLFAQVTWPRLDNAQREPQNWLTHSGTNLSQRYSTLTDIKQENVKTVLRKIRGDSACS